MRVVFKYQLTDDVTRIEMPQRSRVIHVAQQHAGTFPTLWIEHFDSPETVLRKYVIHGTGAEFEDGVHVGSAMCGPFVWHVFEIA